MTRLGQLAIIGMFSLSSGCAAFSASSLRCGTDGEASFVDLVNVPQDISSQSRHFAELCGFAYDQEQT